jgi:hypothetical protein
MVGLRLRAALPAPFEIIFHHERNLIMTTPNIPQQSSPFVHATEHPNVNNAEDEQLTIPRRPLRTGVRTRLVRLTAGLMAISSFVGVASITARPASATTFDNWAGNLQLDYKSATGQTLANVQNFVGLNTSLEQVFTQQWGQALTGICPLLNAEVAHQLSDIGYSMANWDSCWVNPTGYLQATMLSPSRLDLKFRVPGSSFSFDVNAFSNPTISASYDFELELSISINSTVNGTDTSSSPPALTLDSVTAEVLNADFSTNNYFVKILAPSFASSADQAMDSAPINISALPGHPDFYGLIAGYSVDLIHAAHYLSKYVVQPSTPGANEHFDLFMGITDTNLVITLARDGVPPAGPPVGCAMYGANVILCAQQQPSDISELLLNVTGGPVVQPVSYRESGGWTSSNQIGQPELSFDGVGTYQVSTCGANLWGSTCTAPTTVTLGPPPSGGGASASGGGVAGGSGQPGSGPRVHAHE